MAKRKKRAAPKRERGGATYLCPECGEPTEVLTTRRVDGVVERRRQCARKHRIITTTEEAVDGLPLAPG